MIPVDREAEEASVEFVGLDDIENAQYGDHPVENDLDGPAPGVPTPMSSPGNEAD
jgi:hypothetical protein